MVWWTGLAPWEFEFPFPGSLISTFLQEEETLSTIRTVDLKLPDKAQNDAALPIQCGVKFADHKSLRNIGLLNVFAHAIIVLVQSQISQETRSPSKLHPSPSTLKPQPSSLLHQPSKSSTLLPLPSTQFIYLELVRKS